VNAEEQIDAHIAKARAHLADALKELSALVGHDEQIMFVVASKILDVSKAIAALGGLL